MILTRTPLRVTLGGGGTDLDSYPGDGFCVAAAIDKYVYVSVCERFDGDLLVTYSRSERVPEACYLEHPLAKGCLEATAVKTGVHVSSMADIPAGTGLGSSGAYTVGLLKALHVFKGMTDEGPGLLAREACRVEGVGQQDQHIAAFGGVKVMVFTETRPQVRPLPVPDELEENLLLFYTGTRRAAGDELAAQVPPDERTRELGFASRDALVDGDLDGFARLLSAQWALKYERSPSGFHDTVDDWLRIGREAGAGGGKLVGAGGGGFLLFYAEHKSVLREAMAGLGLREVRFGFDHAGSRVLVS